MDLHKFQFNCLVSIFSSAHLLPTAYVVRREGYVLTRVCLSTPGGVPRPGPDRGYPSQVWWGGGYPAGVSHLRYPHQIWLGVPCQGVPYGEYPAGGTPPHQTCWGVPCWGYPAGGVPCWGVSHLGTPPIRPGQGVPCWGGPHLGYLPPPLSDLAGGGTPPRVTDGVLDTPRSVCLLRSRRRTFL